MKRAFGALEVIAAALLVLVFTTSILLLYPPSFGSIKNSLEGIYKGVNTASKGVEEQIDKTNANKIIWVINNYLLPYSNDGTALAALSYQLAYQLGLISYRAYQNYVNSFNIPSPIGGESLICCEIDMNNCKLFLDSDREFCIKMDGIVHNSECRVYLRLSEINADELFVILDSPFPIEVGNNYYFVPTDYIDFISESGGKLIENLNDIFEIELNYPSYYCEKGDTPSDIRRIFPQIDKQYTIYRYLGPNRYAFCSPNLKLECNNKQ